MKRVIVALAVLLGLYGLARAEYIIIIYDLSAGSGKQGGGRGGAGGMFPGGGAGGMLPGAGAGGTLPGGIGGGGNKPPVGGVGGGVPGGATGGSGVGGGGFVPPGGGMGGTVPPGGATGGPGGPPNGGGSRPPAGVAGASGGGPPGGASGGGPPGGGGVPPAPGGFGGSMGPPGGAGGGMGMGGMPGGGFGGFLPGGNGADQQDVKFTPLFAIAVVEVHKMTAVRGGGGAVHAYHKWSPLHGSWILPQAQDKQIFAVPLHIADVKKRYEVEHQRYHPNGKASPEGLRELAGWALKHGLLDDFVKVMEEWIKLDPKEEAVVAFQQVQKDMAKPMAKPDNPNGWKGQAFGNYKITNSDHYALLHTLESPKPGINAPEVDSRLKRLEANYRTFFYWFALKGKALPVPDQRMVAVLVKSAEEFKRQERIFDAHLAVAEGFLARRENMAVFSLERTDLASEALARNTKSKWSKVLTDRDTTLRLWPKDNNRLPLAMHDGAEMQTIALLERALQEDAEISAVSHEGTRQLLAATGQLPRNVEVPEWLAFGWASFFETPKGSPWLSIGTPSATLLGEYNYLGQYKAADKAGKLEKQRYQTLVKVVTDSYFREAARDPSEEAHIKARTLSWSLMFFLANMKPDGLMKYHAELRKLPRDLEFDPMTLLTVFARSFDCLDASSPNTVDPGKLDKLARDWHAHMMITPSEEDKLLEEVTKAKATLKGSPPPKLDGPAPKY